MRNTLMPLLGATLGTCIVWLSSPQFDGYLASRWCEVHGISVADSEVAVSPRMQVHREIHRPFLADWTVTLRREVPAGFEYVCSGSGRNDYLIDATVPANTDLNWWMGIPPNARCRHAIPGRYKVTVVWNINVNGQPLHAVRAESNVFELSGPRGS